MKEYIFIFLFPKMLENKVKIIEWNWKIWLLTSIKIDRNPKHNIQIDREMNYKNKYKYNIRLYLITP